jgi:imidazole glycerol-phosphate synthase subunit HisH
LIGVLDYGMGNLRSVLKAFESIGASVKLVERLSGIDRLVIPGVGAFGAAMERIGPLRDEIRAFAAGGSPVLGICLGQQLLFDESEEMGRHEGLGLVPGRVRYLPAEGRKVPHMGWSPLAYRRRDGLVADATEGEQVYFVHSLYTECDDPADVAATADYGVEFPAMVARDNVWGAQFHPEKSGAVGLRMLERFAR